MYTNCTAVKFSDLQHVGTVQRDYGFCKTTPSAFWRKENDCFHYDAEGSIRKVDVGFLDMDFDPNDQGLQRITFTIPGSGKRVKPFGATCVIIDDDGSILHSWEVNQVYNYTSGTIRKKIFRWRVVDVTKVSDNHYDWYADTHFITYDKNGQEITHDTARVLVHKNRGCSSDYKFSVPREAVTVGYGDIVLGMPLAEKDPIVKGLISQQEEEYSFGDLSASAAKSVRIADINGIAYLRDFAEMGKLAQSLTSISGVGKSALGTMKIAASAYLAIHYGVKLTALDSQTLADGIDRIDLDHQFCRIGAEHASSLILPGHPDVVVAARCRLSGQIKNWSREQLYFADKVKKTVRAAYEFDLVPSFANIWDLLPWTFVVDWIAPIGPAAEQLETKNYLHHLDVHKLFYSRKFTWHQDIHWSSDNWSAYSGSVRSKVYIRHCEKQFALPPLRVDSPLGSLSSHWLEATALAIQVI
jgi:hypothetical protein